MTDTKEHGCSVQFVCECVCVCVQLKADRRRLDSWWGEVRPLFLLLFPRIRFLSFVSAGAKIWKPRSWRQKLDGWRWRRRPKLRTDVRYCLVREILLERVMSIWIRKRGTELWFSLFSPLYKRWNGRIEFLCHTFLLTLLLNWTANKSRFHYLILIVTRWDSEKFFCPLNSTLFYYSWPFSISSSSSSAASFFPTTQRDNCQFTSVCHLFLMPLVSCLPSLKKEPHKLWCMQSKVY